MDLSVVSQRLLMCKGRALMVSEEARDRRLQIPQIPDEQEIPVSSNPTTGSGRNSRPERRRRAGNTSHWSVVAWTPGELKDEFAGVMNFQIGPGTGCKGYDRFECRAAETTDV